MVDQILNTEDIIDSRDVIERISDLESEESLGDVERAELESLRKLASQGADYAEDWEYGEVLIRGTYFKEYAQQLADDIGAVSADARWPNNHIDWGAAAEELKTDYTSIKFDGVDYWIR